MTGARLTIASGRPTIVWSVCVAFAATAVVAPTAVAAPSARAPSAPASPRALAASGSKTNPSAPAAPSAPANPSALLSAPQAQEIAAETAQEAAEEAAESAEDAAAATAYDELERLNPRHAQQIEHLKALIARYRADLKVVRKLPHTTKRWIEHRPRKMLHIKECRERIAELRSLAPWRQ